MNHHLEHGLVDQRGTDIVIAAYASMREMGVIQ
jgi:hypothetical protein